MESGMVEAVRDLPVHSFGGLESDSDDDDNDWAGAMRIGTRRLLRGAWEDTSTEDDSERGGSCPPLPKTSCVGPALLVQEPLLSFSRFCQKAPCEAPEQGSAQLVTPSDSCERHEPASPVALDVAADSAVEEAPPVRGRAQKPLTPPPKRAAGVHRSPRQQAVAMVPMLRAKHMNFLDEQYLNDSDARPPAQSARTRRSASQHGRPRTCGGRLGGSKSPSAKATNKDHREVAQKRLLGPKAVMPSVRGQLRIQAETAQRDADKELREARLKEQFRSRPSTRPRTQSQIRNTRPTNT